MIRGMVKILLLMLLMSQATLQVRGEDTVIISPQINISAVTGDQGWYGVSDAFDSINSRFLVIWTDGGVVTSEVDLYGQMVNADGALYGSTIAISTLNGSIQYMPKVAFDHSGQRFLVVWVDNRNGISNIYGQLVNSDGSLYGNNFNISPIPPEYHRAEVPIVQFDTINNRFLVVWIGPSSGLPYNIYGQFVNPDGSFYGSMIQFTNYGADYYVAYPDIEFDSNNGRFLITWANQYDGYVYGRLVNADGTFYGSEITIGYYGLGNSYAASLSFDPVNSRFLPIWWRWQIRGQLINADGTLYGTEISIFSNYTTSMPSVVFDSVNNKFVITASINYPYNGIVGQLLNIDGSLYDSDFRIFEVIYPGREGHMGSYPPLVASGSGETGSLIVYIDIPYWSLSRYDIFGKFVKLETISSTIGYSALVATGQNTYLQASNGTFGLLLKGQTKTINNSVILNNTGDISAKVEARFNDSIAGVFGVISGANVLNATNFALGIQGALMPLSSAGANVPVAVAAPGATALDARLGVPSDQIAGDYSGTVILTFSNNV